MPWSDTAHRRKTNEEKKQNDLIMSRTGYCKFIAFLKYDIIVKFRRGGKMPGKGEEKMM